MFGRNSEDAKVEVVSVPRYKFLAINFRKFTLPQKHMKSCECLKLFQK